MAAETTLSFASFWNEFQESMLSPRTALVATVVVVAVLGCAPVEVVDTPLIDDLHPPLVLVEGRRLSLPNTGPGTRWVSGWLFDDAPGGLTITPESFSARLEFVHLRARSRFLSLSTRGDASGLEVGATIGSRRLETATSPAGIEISLPADLAQGRNLVDLEFADGAGVGLSGASMSTAAKAGAVALEGDVVVQHPWSAVDFVRWVESDATLLGEFAPPPDANPSQRFAVVLDRGDDELETVLEMRPTDGIVPIRVPLRTTAGLVRVRLMAEGTGPAGRWRGLRVRHRSGESTAGDSGPPAPPKIVVVYVLDALRADAVGFLGSDDGATPCMDRLAAEGAVFADHFSVAPNTGPSTMSLFTGYGYLRGQTISDEGPPTLAEDFAAAGYRTVSVSSNPHLSRSFGLTRGFEDVIFEPVDEDFSVVVGDPTVNDSAEKVHAAALEWLDGLDREDRAFLYLHTLNPHNPYTPPAPFPSFFLRPEGSRIDGGTKTLVDIRNLELEVTAEDERRLREWYTAGVAYNDNALCGFVGEIERRIGGGFLLVVTSDHGEELFDHDGVLHGYTLYDELLHVPLVMWWPARIPSTRIERATDTLDLTAALRALTSTGSTEVPEGGTDLWAALAGDKNFVTEEALHFATAPGLRRAAMVRSNRWKLVLAPRPRFAWGMGKGRGRTHDAEYLFDLIDDPEERLNLAGADSLEVNWLRSRLEGWVDYWEARQPERDDERLDETTRRQLEALGYVD